MMPADRKLAKPALYAHLRRAILTTALAPGADLDEVQLAQDFALSRTPLREVLRQLAGEGYVELRENRGARVAEMSYGQLRSFFQAAPMIYGAVLQLAAQAATPAQIDRLKLAQLGFDRALRQGDAAERTLANTEFHNITGEMAHNAYLLPSLQRLLIDHARIGMTFYDRGSAAPSDKMIEASRQHVAIISAIEDRDPAAAAALAEAHWQLSRDQIESFVLPVGLDARLGSAARPIPA